MSLVESPPGGRTRGLQRFQIERPGAAGPCCGPAACSSFPSRHVRVEREGTIATAGIVGSVYHAHRPRRGHFHCARKSSADWRTGPRVVRLPRRRLAADERRNGSRTPRRRCTRRARGGHDPPERSASRARLDRRAPVFEALVLSAAPPSLGRFTSAAGVEATTSSSLCAALCSLRRAPAAGGSVARASKFVASMSAQGLSAWAVARWRHAASCPRRRAGTGPSRASPASPARCVETTAASTSSGRWRKPNSARHPAEPGCALPWRPGFTAWRARVDRAFPSFGPASFRATHTLTHSRGRGRIRPAPPPAAGRKSGARR